MNNDRDARARRAMPRRKIFQPVALRVGTASWRGHLLDISRSGALLHCTASFDIDATVHMVVNETLLVGTVAWQRAPRIGLSFLLPLAEHQLDRLLAAQTTLAPARA